MHKDLALAGISVYLSTVWIGMSVVMCAVRKMLNSGYFSTEYNPFEKEPGVVENRRRVAMVSVGIASAALVLYLLIFRNYVREGKLWSYAAVGSIIFFGLSYAIYMAWPNKLYFSQDLIVRASELNNGRPFQPTRTFGSIVHMLALCTSVAAVVAVSISGSEYNMS